VKPEELDAAYERGDLNRKDWKELKDKVVSRLDHLRTEARTTGNQQRDIDNRAQSQAEQILSRAVGKGPFDTYDDQDGQLLDAGLRELTARSRAFNGREDPIDVANEIANRWAPIRQERMRLSVETIGRTLRFPATTAAEAMAKLNANRASLPPAVLAQEERKIADMTRAEGASGRTQDRAKDTSGKALRKPGTKPTTGKAED
jgi:hypothetical protein